MFQFSLSQKKKKKNKAETSFSRFRAALSYSPYVYIRLFFIATWRHGLIEGRGGEGGGEGVVICREIRGLKHVSTF